MFFGLFFSLIGVGMFSITLSGVVLYTDFFTTSCPSVNGRLCNNRGVCGKFGICSCEPQFSGEACQHTQCPGYNEITGTTCNGHGLCSPFLTSNQIPLECKEETPSEDNSFSRSGPGWNSQQCQVYVQTQRDRLKDGDLTSIQGIPTCACHAPFGGDACLYNQCPQNSAFEVCSNNGNSSVGYVRNDTTTGNGCQCQRYTSLFDLVQLLSRDELNIVIGKYLNDFRKGFCGTPRRVVGTLGTTSLYFEQQEDDMKCYCNEMYTGITCAFGICPENNGVICSGHGNPYLGFGLELNTIHPNNAKCKPICSPPSVYCNGRCTSLNECNSLEQQCPSTRPWRCASGECVNGDEIYCSREYEYGVWDKISDIPSSIECTYESILNQFSDRRRQLKMEACFGPGVELKNTLFTTTETFFSLPSRLLTVEINIPYIYVNNSNISITYGNQIQILSQQTKNIFNFIRNLTHVIDDQFLDINKTVLVQRIASKRLRILPSLQFDYSTIKKYRLKASSQEMIVGSFSHTEFQASPQGDLFLYIDNTTNLAINYDGQYVSLDFCLDSLSRCLWKTTSYQSLDENKYLCIIDNQANIQTIPCLTPPTILPNYKYLSSMILNINNTWTTISPFSSWKIEIENNPELPQISIFSSQPILSIKYILDQDIRKPCICPPFGTNKTIYHLNWLDEQSTRPDAITPGDYSVGRISQYGIIHTVRGRVISNIPPIIIEQTTGEETTLVEVGRKITSREFKQGTPDDHSEYYLARCINGSSSTLELRTISNVKEDCQCKLSFYGLECTCTNPYGEIITCIDEECQFGWEELLDESCFWSEQLEESITNTGFTLVNTSQWISQDDHSYPLDVVFIGDCNQTQSMYLIELEYKIECIDNQLHLFPQSYLFHPSKQWTIYSNTSILSTTFYENYGGISVTGIPWNYTLKASSTRDGDVQNITSTSRSTWKSSLSDHQVYIQYDFYQDVSFVSVFLDVVNAGIYTSVGSISIKLYIEASIDQAYDSWVTIGSMSTDVINGTDRRTIIVHNEGRVWRSIRLYSFFPLEVRTFIPFVTQNCSIGRLSGSVPQFESEITRLLRHPPNTDPDCICNDNCTLNNNNNRCEDSIFLGINSSLCIDGTDCSDCGSNKRTLSVDPTSRCASKIEQELLEKFNLLSNPSLNTIWTLKEFIYLGMANLTFNYTSSGSKTTRWVRPMCHDECLFYTCLDGSCADTPSLCPETYYNCPGNGCVRATIERNEYTCACDKGHGGLECELTICTPGDPETGLISPHKWCSTNGPSPLKIHPSFQLVLGSDFRALTDTDVLEINRPSTRISFNDVGWVNIRASKAPYGIPFLRIYERSGTRFYTTCPYRVKTNLGLFLELEQCVEKRGLDFPHIVLEWKIQADNQTIIWDNETHYDDAPYRCPSGHCVAHQRECYSLKLRDPPCGNIESFGMVDGTCQCPYGYESWFINEELTLKGIVPYPHKGEIMQTTVWGEEDDNQFVSEWCRARNCSEVDCSPPMGCFPGTPELDFKDRYRECPGPTNKGMCGLTIFECREGNVIPPQVCSGNGELRQRDYRKDEWYCECGSIKDGVFQANGFGGRHCQHYYCEDNPNIIYFSRHHPFTLELYRDINGYPLPGKWIGPCQTTIGANPDDIIEWNQCCPKVTQLETCTQIPCIVGGVTQCVDIEECQGIDRTPKVYVCNGKGTALADGSCNCDTDEESGIGYTYDLSVYSTKGCFKRVQCSSAITTGRICNKYPSCSDFTNWMDLPTIPYLWNQVYVYAVREGLPPTNETIVRKIYQDNLQEVVNQAYIQDALELLTDQRAAQSCICVLSYTDTCDNPPGMLPCGDNELIYRKSIPTPYSLFDYTFSEEYSNLIDRYFYADLEAEKIENNTNSIQSLTFSFNFTSKYTIDFIRLHLVSNSLVSVTFLNEHLETVCQPVEIQANSDYVWEDIYCILQYNPARFDLLYPVEWRSNCLNNEKSLVCIAWIRQTCPLIPRSIIQETNSLQLYQGCGDALCCVATSDKFSPSLQITLSFSSSVIIDEVSFFGHSDQALPLPSILAEIIETLTGSTSCVDERVFFDPAIGLQGHLSFFRPDSSLKTMDESHQECRLNGGVLASYTSSVDIVSGYARPLGLACYDDGIRLPETTPCYVNARDRNEALNAKNMSHLIDSDCSTYGCWNPYSTNIRYHHDPKDGSQWDSAWYPGIITWESLFLAISAKKNLQNSNYFRNHLYRRTFTNADLTNPTNTPTINGWKAAGDFSAGFPPTPHVTYTAPSPNPSTLPPDDDYRDIWTDDETCSITFYSLPNCNAWCYYQYGSDCDITHTQCDTVAMNGASRTIHITPENYETYFDSNGLLDVLNLPFQEADDICFTNPNNIAPTSGPTEYYYGTRTHVGLGTNVLTISRARSLSIRGNCRVILQGGATDNEYTYTTNFSPHSRIGEVPQFYNIIFNPVTDAYQGCSGQIYTNSGKPRDSCTGWTYAGLAIFPEFFFQQDYCGSGFDHINGCPFNGINGYHPSYNGFSTEPNWIGDAEIPAPSLSPNSNVGQGQAFSEGRECQCCDRLAFPDTSTPFDRITFMQIIPLFENHKLRIRHMAQRFDKSPNTDRARIGYIDHPYMPMAVKIERIQIIFNNIPGIYSRNDVLLDDVAVIPIATSGPTFFTRVGTSPSVNNPTDINFPFVTVPQYKKCSECVLQNVGNYQFNQEVVNQDSFDFINTVDVMLQNSVNGGPLSYPKMWVTYENFTLGPTYIEDLSNTEYYGRLISSLTVQDYNSKFEMEYCVQVARITTANDYEEYQFQPVRCSSLLYPVCIQDTNKYAVALGYQCDACGASCRIPTIQPNITVYDLFPRLDPNNDPFSHELLQSYLDGTLDAFIANSNNIPWDRIVLQLKNTSILQVFPEAMDDLLNQISTRPRYLSPGQTEDFATWRDMALARRLPYDCGLVVNPDTGEEKHICAISKQYCDYKYHFEGKPMASEDQPNIFTNIGSIENIKNTLCTVPIKPQEFHIYTNEGKPQPSSPELEVLTYDEDKIILRVLQTNGTWTNSGRRLIAPLNTNFTIVGTIYSSIAIGYYRIWVGVTSPTFQRPKTIEYISDWTPIVTEISPENEFILSHTPNNSFLAVLGIDFIHLQPASYVTIQSFLLSNQDTLSFCQAIPSISWVELPSYIESYSLHHTCNFKQGVCYCAPDSPYGGPNCEWPAINFPQFGKLICSGYGENGGLALDSLLQATPVIEQGIFYDQVQTSFDCKCQNIGLMIETIQRPSSAFDYAYVLRKDKLPNADEFILVDPPQDIPIPVSYQDAIQTCASVTASLPSWNTGDEIVRFNELETTNVFVDLIYNGDTFYWEQRDHPFNYDTNETEIINTDPCPNINSDLCSALNWNNLAFDPLGDSFVDGSESFFLSHSSFNITIFQSTSDITIELFVNGTYSGVIVDANGNRCTTREVLFGKVIIDCLFPNLYLFEFNYVFPGIYSYQEVRIFSYQDTSRVPGYFF